MLPGACCCYKFAIPPVAAAAAAAVCICREVQHVTLPEYVSNLQSMVSSARGAGITNILLLTPPPVHDEGRVQQQQRVRMLMELPNSRAWIFIGVRVCLKRSWEGGGRGVVLPAALWQPNTSGRHTRHTNGVVSLTT